MPAAGGIFLGYNVIFWSWLAADTVPDPKLLKMDFSRVLERGVEFSFEGWGVF